MSIVFDTMILFFIAAQIFIKGSVDVPDMILKYAFLLTLLPALLFLFKYGIYTFQTVQDIRFAERSEGGKRSIRHYIILGVYPACDLIRYAAVVGIVSAIINGVSITRQIIDPTIDVTLLIVYVILSIIVNYACNRAETVRANVIITVLFVGVALFFVSDFIAQGLSLF